VTGLASVLGGGVASVLAVTCVLFGAAAALAGQALARNWRKAWQVAPYALLLAAADRFLLYALFGAELLSVSGYLVAAAVIYAIAALAYRVTQAGRMVAQYPWLYERAGPFSWRERGG
jgi:Domain of unknown function (DUF6867)